MERTWLGCFGAFACGFIGLLAGIAIANVLSDGDTAWAILLTLFSLLFVAVPCAWVGARQGNRLTAYLHDPEVPRRRKAGRVVGVLALLSALWLVTAATALSSRMPPPDGPMIRNLDRRRPAMERIVAMLEQDRELGWISADGGAGKESIVTPARHAEYRRLMESAQIRRVRVDRECGLVLFSTWIFGRDAKGYTFDMAPQKNKDRYRNVLRPIRGSWGLFSGN